MRLVLYQPDIPQNTGTILRLAACLGISVDVIEPCGFVWSEPRLRRAGMDYIDLAAVRRHSSWEAFLNHKQTGRLVLTTTRSPHRLDRVRFEPTDLLLMGREGAGVPDRVHDRVDMSVRIPMVPEVRSLNVAVAAALVLGEALRQTSCYPEDLSSFE